jgi:tetratricopeptide (TPR) repeat protein
MSRFVPPYRLVAFAFVALGIVISSTAVAQEPDLGDLDMFGDTPDAQTPATEDDPLNLDDFGGLQPGAETDTGELQPEQKTYEQALQEGIELAANGNLAEAVGTFNALLNPQAGGNPRFAPAALELAKAYVELGELQLATQYFGQAINDGAPFPGVVAEANIELGTVLLEQGLNADAVESFSQAVQTDPFDAFALFMRGKALIRSATSFAAGPGALEQVEQAIDSLDRAIGLDDGNTEAYRERSRAYSITQQWDKAIADSDQSLQLDPESPETIARRGYTYLYRGANERNRPDADTSAAIADLQVAVEAFDDYLMIEGGKKKEDFEDADPETVRPDEILSAKADAQIVIGNELGREQGSTFYRQSMADARQLIEYDPDSANGYYQLGIAQRLLGDLRAAIESWDDAVERSPGNPEFFLRRGIAWYYLGENRLARRDFEAAEPAFDGRALFWSGVTYAKEGDFNRAVRLYTAALRLAPNFKPAYNNRGLAYMRLGEYARAEREFDELVRLDPDDTVSVERRDQARQRNETALDSGSPSAYYP